MANIRNTKLGGTNYTEEGLKPSDVNVTNDAIIEYAGKGVAQNAYMTLQANNIFVNQDALAADEFTDVSGTNNTVNTYLQDYVIGSPYVIIEATSVSTASFAINNCKVIPYSAGKWVLYCTTGTNEVMRAKIYKTLFYGTTGADPRATSTCITGITALKTSISGDVGTIAYYATLSLVNPSVSVFNYTYTGTFSNTTTNTKISSWSNNNAALPTISGNTYANWELPSGTTLNQASRSGSAGTTTVDETGIDTTADEKSNQTTCQLEVYSSNIGTGRNSSVDIFILTKGTISWVNAGTAGTTVSYSNVNFNVTHSIPTLTAAESIIVPSSANYATTNFYYSLTPGTDTSSSDTTYNLDSFTNPTYAFDSNDTTAATLTIANFTFGKTFSTSRNIGYVKLVYGHGIHGGSNAASYFQTYNGSTWTNHTLLASTNSSLAKTTYVIVVNASVQGIAINSFCGNPGDISIYSIEYGAFTTGKTVTCDTGILSLDGTESSLAIYTHATIPTGSSITVDVSDGTNTISAQPIINNYVNINISSLSSGNLKLVFNLNTVDTSKSPIFYGWGLYLYK